MGISRGRLGAGLLLASTIVAGHEAIAQRTQGLTDACRRELMTICGGGDLRNCVRTRAREFGTACQAELRSLAQNRARVQQDLPAGATELAFGSDPLQRLDFYPAKNMAGGAPLVVFIHGGGWSIGDKRFGAAQKAAHFNARGFAVASVNYRLVPNATVEQQAQDVAAALAHLRANARTLGIDPDRLVLVGHSAGAHLAALVGTDTAFLSARNIPLAAIDGIVLLDGAGYDVPAQMANPRNAVGPMYQAAFGSDVARQRRLSPTFNAAAPNVGNWLIMPVVSRRDSTAQSQALAAALQAAGATAVVSPQAGKTHATLNRELGAPDDPSTAEVDRFLAGLTSAAR